MSRLVVVVGAGNAALCAAIAAREQGRDVVVLEAATIDRRGGNTFYAGGQVRMTHDGLADLRSLLPDLTESDLEGLEVMPYSADRYLDVWGRTSGHRNDTELSATVVERSHETIRWITSLGTASLEVARSRFVRSGGKTVLTGDVPLRWRGGGAGLSEALFAAAEQRGVEIRYGTRAIGLALDDSGTMAGVDVIEGSGRRERLASRAVVLACGGFEANAAWRSAYLGPGWDVALVRGTEYNVGDGHRMAFEAGARSAGHWSGCHAVAWELHAPQRRDHSFAHGYERHSYPLGIVVNNQGKRFIDEGEDFQSYTYAKYGRTILAQPDAMAFQIFDGKVEPLLRNEYRLQQATTFRAPTLEGLARMAGIAVGPFVEMVEQYNASVTDDAFDPAVLDGRRTTGSVVPPKSNWANALDTPDYFAFPVTCGITFTFGGIAVDTDARVLGVGGRPISGLFAAGEIVGGLFYGNYPAGSGLVAGSVMGRLAGIGAADS